MRSFLLLALLLAGPLHAQTVRGTLVEEGSGAPVAGTLVLLLDAGGGQAAGALTDPSGAFLLSAPAPGRYRLKAERIGHATALSPVLELRAGETVEHRLAAPAQAVALEGLVVRRERKRCEVRPEAGRQAAVLWEEARKALTTTVWTEGQRTHRYLLARHERELDPRTLRVEREKTETTTAVSANPYVSLPADELAEGGFVQRRDDGTYYYAPDARVLLSDAFLDGHCFQVRAGERGSRGLIGLAFEPVRGRERGNVRGVLWLDPRTSELRHLEYSYTGVDLSGPTEHLGGRVEFERLPAGGWVVRRWRIRMPVVAREMSRLGRSTVRSERVGGIREEGGEILEVRTLRGEPVRAAGGARLAGTAYDSTRAAPLAGARVRLAGTAHAVGTDAHGRFRMEGLPPARYRVELEHPRLDSLGIPSPSAEVELREGDESRLELALPPLGGVRARLCPEGIHPREGIVAGVVRGADGARVEGARVVLAWTRWDVRNEERQSAAGEGGRGAPPVTVVEDAERVEATTDAQGRYRICGVPADVRLRLTVAGADPGEGTVLRLSAGELHVRDLTPGPPRTAAPEGAAPVPRQVELDGLTVSAERRSPRLQALGFYDRRKMGSGRFFGEEETRERSVADVVRSAGVRVQSLSTGFVATLPRAFGHRGGCRLAVFLDGHPVTPAQMETSRVARVEAIEVYRGEPETPPRFRAGHDTCGAVVLWTTPDR